MSSGFLVSIKKNKLTADRSKNITDLVKKARQGLPQTAREKN